MTTTTRDTWRDLAACRDIAKEVFFPEVDDNRSNIYNQARQICASCPVQEECLIYALQNSIIHGMFGGKSPNQRRQEARDRGYTVRFTDPLEENNQ